MLLAEPIIKELQQQIRKGRLVKAFRFSRQTMNMTMMLLSQLNQARSRQLLTT